MRMRIWILLLLSIAAVGRAVPVTTTTAKPAPNAPAPPAGQQVAPAPEAGRDALLERSVRLLQEQQRLLAQRSMIPPPPPRAPAPPIWLLPLVVIAAVASATTAVLQPFLYRRARVALAASFNGIQAVESKLDAGVRFIADNAQKTSAQVTEKLQASHETTISRLTSVVVEIGEIKERVGEVAATIGETATARPGGGDAVRLEHQVLAEHWKQFREKKDPGEVAPQEHAWENLLNELPSVVPSDLRPSLDAVLTPYREHRLFIQKIGIIPRVVSGEMPLTSEAAELKRARDLTQLLNAAQSGDASRVQFQFQNWVTDTFLPFADLYLQSYQKALLEQRNGDLQKGMSLVREILRTAAVEPIDVTLGETRFDSARHIGRFTSNDPHFPDGVITGVVRNGFVEGGHQVLRQPEVVVNRVR